MAEVPRKSRQLDAAGLLQYAARALASRALSAGELRQKLERRAQSPGDVRGVLERLKEMGALDDRRFAEAFSTARLESNGFGKQRVLRDLRRRRVAPALARETVEQVYSEADERALIEDFLRRKFRRVDLAQYLAEPRQLASAYRRLRTAGFSSGNSIAVLKRHSAAAEALESLDDEEPT